MKIFPFQINDEQNVILIEVIFDFSTLIFLLDTGASHSIIDFSTVLIEGYSSYDFIGTESVETANGVIEANILEIKFLKGIGIVKENFKIMTYDFIENGLFTNFHGVLGLDFLNNNKICIDFLKSEISTLY